MFACREVTSLFCKVLFTLTLTLKRKNFGDLSISTLGSVFQELRFWKSYLLRFISLTQNLLWSLRGTDRQTHLHTMLGRLDSEHVEHYLIGDMNCHLLSGYNIHTMALLSITEMYGLTQCRAQMYVFLVIKSTVKFSREQALIQRSQRSIPCDGFGNGMNNFIPNFTISFSDLCSFSGCLESL